MKNFLDNHLLIEVSIGISFSIRKISSTYNMKNVIALSLTLLYTQDFSLFLMKPNDLIVSSK